MDLSTLQRLRNPSALVQQRTHLASLQNLPRRDRSRRGARASTSQNQGRQETSRSSGNNQTYRPTASTRDDGAPSRRPPGRGHREIRPRPSGSSQVDQQAPARSQRHQQQSLGRPQQRAVPRADPEDAMPNARVTGRGALAGGSSALPQDGGRLQPQASGRGAYASSSAGNQDDGPPGTPMPPPAPPPALPSPVLAREDRPFWQNIGSPWYSGSRRPPLSVAVSAHPWCDASFITPAAAARLAAELGYLLEETIPEDRSFMTPVGLVEPTHFVRNICLEPSFWGMDTRYISLYVLPADWTRSDILAGEKLLYILATLTQAPPPVANPQVQGE